MSLNALEIDTIIAEWNLAGARVQGAYQPEIQILCLELYTQDGIRYLHAYFHPGAVRLYITDYALKKPSKPQRFQQLLQSRIIGARIADVQHMDHNRIVRFMLTKKNESGIVITRYLYLKLWSNNANMIYTDEQNTIIDLLYRSTKQRLMPKKTFELPPPSSRALNPMRQWTGECFNEFTERHYAHASRIKRNEETQKKAHTVLKKRLLYLQDTIHGLRQHLNETNNQQKYIDNANTILAHAHNISGGQTELRAEGATIPLDPMRSPAENAQSYFTKASKAKTSRTMTQKRLAACASEITAVSQFIDELHTATKSAIQPERLSDKARAYVRLHTQKKSNAARADRQSAQKRKARVGITLRTPLGTTGCTITIGRNAKENDILLRTASRGDDMWMHVRGERGGFVFIRPHASQKTAIVKKNTGAKHKNNTAGRTMLPPDVMLKCAQLAALYSKAKDNTDTDVHYTYVKYVKRIKGSIGMVIPSPGKTLRVRVNKQSASEFVAAHQIRG